MGAVVIGAPLSMGGAAHARPRPPTPHLQVPSFQCRIQTEKPLTTMKVPRPHGARWPGRWRGRTGDAAEADPDRSSCSTDPAVEKASGFFTGFYQESRTFPLVNSNRGSPVSASRHTEERAQIALDDAPGVREPEAETGRPERRPEGAAGPDRAPSAPRRAHRRGRPSDPPAGSQRKGDRKSDRRERTVGRSL